MQEQQNISPSSNDDIGLKLDAAIKRIEELEEKFKAMPTPRDLGFNIPIHSFTHDKNFRHQLDRGHLTLQLNTDELRRNMSATAGGGGGGVQNSEYEQTYVNSIGYICDPTDPECGLPFDVSFRDRISMTDGVLTRELQNAFVQFHPEGRFLRCSGSCSDGYDDYLDRWRPCGVEDDSEDIFLSPEIFNLLPEEIVEPVILLQAPNKCFTFVESGVTGEAATNPEPFIYIYDGCASAECPKDPCEACTEATNVPTQTLGPDPLCPPEYDGAYVFVSHTVSVGFSVIWNFSKPAIGDGAYGALQIRCADDGTMTAGTLLAGTSFFGDGAGGFKDVTGELTCVNGQLVGTIRLFADGGQFCTPGDGAYVDITF